MELALLKSAVSRISTKINAIEDKRKKSSAAIKLISNIKFKIGNLTDDLIINSCEKKAPSSLIAGVDGGMLAKSFHGIDLVIIRAVGVVFDYKNGKIKKSEVFAPKAPFIIDVDSEAESELIIVASLYRMIEEVGRAIEVVKKTSPAYILMDGPLYPHPSTRIAKGNKLKKIYDRVVKLYNELAKVCESNKTILVGIVEDSRSRYFASVLMQDIIPSLPEKHRKLFSGMKTFRDTALLFDALNVKERTFTFKISGIQDLNYKNHVYAFYTKTAKYDRPLRVEFLSKNPGNIVNDVANTIQGLSSFSTYGLPSVIIEADARAKLTSYYFEYISRMLFSKSLSPLLMQLRRENRPL